MSRKRINFEGQRFGKLLVNKYIGKNKYGLSRYECLCDCGETTEVYLCNLKSGQTKSCGCLRKEINTTHGQTNTRTYRIWADMNKRCLNQNCKEYKNYGGRDITVCERWDPQKGGSFENFFKDMGEKPKNKTLDRIKNNLGYYKENCHWATTEQQSRNKRNNIILTHNGKKQCLQDWSEETGVLSTTIRYRIDHGWTVEKALTTLTKNHRKKTLQQSYDEMYKNIEFPIPNTHTLWKYLNV